MSSSKWFDYTGSDHYWNSIPLLTVKRAFLKKGGTIKSLAKLILNSVTYDFEKSAQGGAVIMSSNYSTIEFISPDGRLPYDDYLTMTLGQVLDSMEDILAEKPIPAWDRFAAWLGNNDNIKDLTGALQSCVLATFDGGTKTTVNIPDFSGVVDMVTFLDMLENAVYPALGQSLSGYLLDNAVFGCRLIMTSYPDENGATATLDMGFMFRE